MMYELLKGLKKVTTNCYLIFEPFYEARSRVYLYPTFYQSITEMAARQCFWYKIENNTLLIFKRKSIMGNGCIFLQIAPISLNNDAQKELRYIQQCFKCGISAKLNDEDIRRYHLPKNVYAPDKDNIEFIFDANQYYRMSGSKFTKHRNALKRFQKIGGFVLNGYSIDIDKVVESWTKLKNSTQTQLFKTTKSIKNTKCFTIRLYSQIQIEAFSFTERISKNTGIIVQRLRNYNSEINDISSVIHYYDCKQYQSDKSIKVYLNMGAAVGISGMAKSKHYLRPVAMVQIYKTQPHHKLSKNEFEKTKTLFQ